MSPIYLFHNLNMASDDKSNQAASEPNGEQKHSEGEESTIFTKAVDELTAEEIAQLQKEGSGFKRDYAALKSDYDKQAHKAKAEKPVKKSDESDASDEEFQLWVTENAPTLKMVKEEYRTYRQRGYSRDDALYLARRDKGLIKEPDGEAERQRKTASEGQDDLRKPKAKPQKPKNFMGTQEDYERIEADKEAERNALRGK